MQLALPQFGRVTVLISNAGIASISLLEDRQVAGWKATIDVNIKGLLYGIAAAMPVFRRQSFGHFGHLLATADLTISPTMVVYGAPKTQPALSLKNYGRKGANCGCRPSCPALSKPAWPTDSMGNAEVRAQTLEQMSEIVLPPDAIACATAFAIEQPMEVDVNENIIRPTAQG